ncbi:hypothetical protein GB931_04235 [Modestobacter sp. I12A-02628]|uniref:ARB-07466-like C-terminal domain-containing protein n=1 Tax=Goekera deserti TaxID=2497753 RepID=A0A7K3WFM8_9ACTN|nr:hypothetical protein [Goekera deserti]MPQ97146.1 hypothetical protein [Goekera deserti]NDI46536.1 hypothetical protein [Goekera deserti]NEL54530.1 hypothetical protein [Goekera deserti]
MAVAGAVAANVLLGAEPAAQADPASSESVAIAAQLGLTAQTGPVEPDMRQLEQLAATRSTRSAAATAAQQTQAAADQAEADRRRQAEEEAAARAAAEAAAARAAEQAAAAAAAQAAEQAAAASSSAATVDADADADESSSGAQESTRTAAAQAPSASVSTGSVAVIRNTSGAVEPQVQAAADVVVSNVPGADGITLGGTRPSATDPGGHPSGLALDYMVMSDAQLGDAIAAYHIAHWDELGVEYVIWEQRMLSSPNGSWKPMEDRGGVTANHFDHVHVNYR